GLGPGPRHGGVAEVGPTRLARRLARAPRARAARLAFQRPLGTVTVQGSWRLGVPACSRDEAPGRGPDAEGVLARPHPSEPRVRRSAPRPHPSEPRVARSVAVQGRAALLRGVLP